ncbi:hypothetical protein CISG_06600 [Coccidioides immitis RMSCC 3703]|uniref:Uncharacterized protein n=1 Tax=Coccidioides immitis RMSCC 3703 TaxID=454286 RepID=A0A0J8QZN9_COCIT|nr:hypothetical protein CISG_06600 [Coccidioides immitis RMSCC 3703]
MASLTPMTPEISRWVIDLKRPLVIKGSRCSCARSEHHEMVRTQGIAELEYGALQTGKLTKWVPLQWRGECAMFETQVLQRDWQDKKSMQIYPHLAPKERKGLLRNGALQDLASLL